MDNMKLNLNVLHTMFFFQRVAFSWHPPVFFSSDCGHVTPPLSSACHVTVRSCCRQRGVVPASVTVEGGGSGSELLDRLSGTTCYHGLQS